MQKTVFLVTEQRTSSSSQEARAIIQQRVTLWLKRTLQKPRQKPD